MTAKILLVDDDRDLVDLLRYAFQRDGYTVLSAFDGEMGLRMWQSDSPDLVVLDLMMPKRDGMQVLQEMRRSSNIPVIVLTALGDEDHVVEALQRGADDYLVKPFRPRELRARAAALIRRSTSQPKSLEKSIRPIELGDVMLDPGTHQVTVAGQPVQLSRTEFSLLHYLMANHNIILPLSDIMANVWGYDAEDNDQVVKVTISRLRRKIEADSGHPRYIINVPGAGYQFQCDTNNSS